MSDGKADLIQRSPWIALCSMWIGVWIICGSAPDGWTREPITSVRSVQADRVRNRPLRYERSRLSVRRVGRNGGFIRKGSSRIEAEADRVTQGRPVLTNTNGVIMKRLRDRLRDDQVVRKQTRDFQDKRRRLQQRFSTREQDRRMRQRSFLFKNLKRQRFRKISDALKRNGTVTNTSLRENLRKKMKTSLMRSSLTLRRLTEKLNFPRDDR